MEKQWSRHDQISPKLQHLLLPAGVRGTEKDEPELHQAVSNPNRLRVAHLFAGSPQAAGWNVGSNAALQLVLPLPYLVPITAGAQPAGVQFGSSSSTATVRSRLQTAGRRARQAPAPGPRGGKEVRKKHHPAVFTATRRAPQRRRTSGRLPSEKKRR